MNMPKLSSRVRLHKNGDGGNLLGFADVVIADAFVIKDVRIIRGKPKDGEDEEEAAPFLSFPAKQGKGEASDKWFDIAFPITREARQAVSECVLREFAKAARA